MGETTKLNLTHYSGAYDSPDERDFLIEEVFDEWGTSEQEQLPKRVILDIVPPLNQGHIGACTLFGSSQAYFETYAQAIKPSQYEQPYELWAIWEIAKTKGASDTKGWGFQAMLQLLADLKKIGGYALLRLPGNRGMHSILNIKRSIAQGRPAVGGSSHTDWNYVVKTGRYKEQEQFSGHIYAYTGYDDEFQFENGDIGGLWIPNSWGGVGGFWISYKQFLEARMYSTYSLLLTFEHERIASLKNKKKNLNLQKALDLKIYDGTRDNDVATATEIRIMVNRILGLPDDYKWFRKMLYHLFNDKIIRDKMLTIYNEKDQYKLASDEEFALMFTRAVTRNPALSILVLSRGQVAEICVRDFTK